MKDASRPARIALTLLVAASVAAGSTGCGKKGPPLPPIRHAPEPVEDLGIRQVGHHILLTMVPPRLRTDGTELRPGTELEIFMVARQPAPTDPAAVVWNPDVIWGVPASRWDAYRQDGRLEVGLSIEKVGQGLDRPVAADDLVDRRLSFVVHALEPKRRASAPSAIRTLVVCAPPAQPAGGSTRLIEKGVEVSWSAGRGGDGTDRYNVYRRLPGRHWPPSPLNAEPLKAETYLDETARPGIAYEYGVRAGSVGCESETGAVARATWTDVFAPVAPEGLAAVTEQGAIRLFWRPSREPDLRGYRVYRRESTQSEMRLLTPDDVTTTTYTDADVKEGIVYIYAVTARDGATPPNESPLSAEATESLE